MPNPFFNYMPQPDNPLSSMMQEVQKLKANPLQYIMQRNLNVPSDIVNDPSAVLNHLLSTGQITQSQVNNAYQMLNSQNGRTVRY